MLFPALSRRVLCSAVLVLGMLAVLPGCKHAYRSPGTDASLGPRLMPRPIEADYNEGAFPNSAPRFEPLPDLSPVPPLPGAGHSLPGDGPLPPSPSPDPVSPTSLQTESHSATRSTPATEATLSANTSPSPVAESAPRWKQMLKVPSFPKRAIAQPLSPLKPGRYSSTIGDRVVAGSATSPPVAARPQSALMQSAQFALRPSTPLFKSSEADRFDSLSTPSLSAATDDAASLPVITPLAPPLRTRTAQIEQWPHHARKSSIKLDSVPRDEPRGANSLDLAPVSPTELLPLPPVAQTVDEASSPSLLPPGP